MTEFCATWQEHLQPGQCHTHTFSERDSLILAVNGNSSHGKVKTLDCLYGLVKVAMHDSHHTACLITGAEILYPPKMLSAQRWGCWWKNKAPCPADTRQTDIRWSLVFRLGGLLGWTAVSRAEDRAWGASGLHTKMWTNKQSEPYCFWCLLILKFSWENIAEETSVMFTIM